MDKSRVLYSPCTNSTFQTTSQSISQAHVYYGFCTNMSFQTTSRNTFPVHVSSPPLTVQSESSRRYKKTNSNTTTAATQTSVQISAKTIESTYKVYNDFEELKKFVSDPITRNTLESSTKICVELLKTKDKLPYNYRQDFKNPQEIPALPSTDLWDQLWVHPSELITIAGNHLMDTNLTKYKESYSQAADLFNITLDYFQKKKSGTKDQNIQKVQEMLTAHPIEGLWERLWIHAVKVVEKSYNHLLTLEKEVFKGTSTTNNEMYAAAAHLVDEACDNLMVVDQLVEDDFRDSEQAQKLLYLPLAAGTIVGLWLLKKKKLAIANCIPIELHPYKRKVGIRAGKLGKRALKHVLTSENEKSSVKTANSIVEASQNLLKLEKQLPSRFKREVFTVEDSCVGDLFSKIPLIVIQDDETTQTCHGIQTDHSTIITAAHCVHGLTPDQLTIVYEDNHDMRFISCDTVTVDNRFEPGKASYDIATVHLKHPVSHRTALPDCIQVTSLREEWIFMVVGGMVDDPSVVPMVVVDKDICASMYYGLDDVEPITCAIPVGDKYPCHGDSGGPVFRVNVPGGVPFGIMVGGHACSDGPVVIRNIGTVEEVTADGWANVGSWWIIMGGITFIVFFHERK